MLVLAGGGVLRLLIDGVVDVVSGGGKQGEAATTGKTMKGMGVSGVEVEWVENDHARQPGLPPCAFFLVRLRFGQTLPGHTLDLTDALLGGADSGDELSGAGIGVIEHHVDPAQEVRQLGMNRGAEGLLDADDLAGGCSHY